MYTRSVAVAKLGILFCIPLSNPIHCITLFTNSRPLPHLLTVDHFRYDSSGLRVCLTLYRAELLHFGGTGKKLLAHSHLWLSIQVQLSRFVRTFQSSQQKIAKMTVEDA